MKKNFRSIYETIRLNTDDIRTNTRNTTTIEKTVQEIKKEQVDFRENLQVETRTMYPFFPAKSNASIFAFLDDSAGMFETKLKEFEKYLLQLSHPCTKKKRQYSDTLFCLLFEKDYQQSHRWPLLGLV